MDISNFKEKNRFFIPNFSLTFSEFLDIFSVFHSKNRVNNFLKFNLQRAKELLENNDVISPIQVVKNEYVIGIDYGFFLQNLIDWIIEFGGIIDENDKEKVSNLIRIFFGISMENKKMNYPSQVLMKELFGRIYGVTNYKNFDLKGNVFFVYFVENSDGKIYKLNLVFFKKISFLKVFLNEEIFENFINFFEKKSSNLISVYDKKFINLDLNFVENLYDNSKKFL